MDLKGIPYHIYKELADRLGGQKAYEYIKSKRFNYQAVVTQILILDIKNYLKKKPLIFTILLILLIVTFIVIYFEDLIFI
jgi:hypothetical protein